MEYVETHVRGGVLRIGIDKRINSLHNVQVEVTVPDNGDIRLLKATSAASIVCDQPLAQQDRVQLSATSAATVRAAVRARECRIGATSSATVCTRLEAETCEVRVSSAARVRMKGSCEQCSLRASSAGRIDAAEFTARTWLGKRLECGERHGTLRRVARRPCFERRNRLLCGRRRCGGLGKQRGQRQ